MVQRTTGQKISTLFGKNLPSHPPDPVGKVVADDTELPYLRGVANVCTYAGTVVILPYPNDTQGLRGVLRKFTQVHY